MEFWRIFRLVWRKRWLIVGMMAISAFVILVGATIKGQQKLYEAVAIISPLDMIQNQANSDNGNNTNANPQQDTSNRISDLVMQLRSSNDLYLRTAELLRQSQKERTESVKRILEKNGYFAQVDAEVESQIKRSIGLKEITPAEVPLVREKQKQANRNRIVASLAEAKDSLGTFREGGIELTPAEITDLIRQKMGFDIVTGPLDTDSNRQVVNQIKITARFEREAEADLYVNMLCVAFIDFYTVRNAGLTNAKIEQTNEKLREAKRQLEEAQRAEALYRKGRVTLTSATDTVISTYVQLQGERDAANRAYNEAVAAVSQLETELARTPETIRGNIPTAENPAVRDLEAQVRRAESDLQELKAEGYDEGWQTVRAARAKLQSTQAALQAAKRQGFGTTTLNPNRSNIELKLSDAKVQRQAALQRLNGLNEQLSRAEAKLRDLPTAQFAVGDLRRETAIEERTVTTLTDQLRKFELEAIEQSKAGTISIVSQAHAELVGGDIAKQRGKLLAFGLILSLICGVALVVGMDALDNSIRTIQDVEKALSVPVMGIIPEHLPDPIRAPKVTYLSPLSPVSEAYRLLRTDLLFTAEEKPFKSLMMATGKPGQGATTTVSNLAITLAQAGKRVILVDTDLRYPKLHRVYGIPNDVGLTSLLMGEVSLEDALLSTDIRNLQVMPAGPVIVNPTELINHERMRALHEQLKKLADFVLFDTPSAAAFADASVMASFVDVTLMVIRASNVPRGSEEHVMRLLTKARANIIGVVLNGVPIDQVDSVHFHEEYYPQLPPVNDPNLYGNSGDRGSRPPIPLALPGEVGEYSPGRPTGNGSSNQTVMMRAPLVQTVTPRATMPKPRLNIDWKTVAVLGTAAIALGALVLKLALSVNVK